ncbi:MFS transporter [Rhizobium sp. CNPSo 4062]|uniref:MFS transporter n=1 Tax=Rhizobium sp. CNPSo 4062 TaxID=3021410 RepID=UPI00254F95F8|nr:MFS transporter [Rhizobium sp. CNPSo 4062]MDK4706455.1 MFS transporter [Rhizobium sp. CNPSo 4062]
MSDKKPLVALAAGTVASVGGTRLSAIAIPWLVLTSTGDPVLTGVVGMAELLPYVAAKAFGGPFIDRIGARRISIWSDGLSAIAVASVPSLYWIDLLSVWLLLPAVALIGILRAPSDAAKQALVPSVASMGKMPLERTTGILGASDRLAGTLGAAGGGALIALIGAAPALLTNAVAFLLASLVVGLGIPRPTVADTAKPRTSATYLHDLAAGWSTLRNESILVTLVLMLAITNLFDQAYATVLLPVWVRSSGLSVTWVGIFLAAFSGAAVAGAAMAAAFAERLPRMLVYTTGFLCAGPAPMAALALDPGLQSILLVLLTGGFAAGFINPIIGAILFERIPAVLVGRVIALVGALAWVLVPFGGLYAGLLVDTFGITLALGVTTLLYLIATLAPLAMPSFREMNRRSIEKVPST